MSHHPSEPGTRLHALDAVRAMALLAGIFFHAALAYAPGMAATGWPLVDPETSLVMSLTVYVIHIVRMPTFFLLAGFFAHMLLQRQGVGAFLHNRTRRIVLPLVIGWVLCFGCILWLMVWHLGRSHGDVPAAPQAGLTLIHLWFLYVLCWFYAGALLLRRMALAFDRRGALLSWLDSVFAPACASPIGALLLAVPVAVAFFLQPGWTLLVGTPTPDHLLPQALPYVIYAYLFALGWLLDRQRSVLDALRRGWRSRLAVGVLATFACVGGLGAAAGSAAPADVGTMLFGAVAYGVAMVSGVLAFIGIGLRFLGHPSPAFRYLADASYWMYIVHLPIVLAMQALLQPMPWPLAVKFASVVVVTLAVSLLTWHVAVRSTWIGQLLNGKRSQRLATGA